MTNKHTAYEKADAVLRGASAARFDFDAAIVPALLEAWLSRYGTVEPDAEIVRTETKGHSYLYDISNTRILAAWSVMRAQDIPERDKSRMRGFPMAFGGDYHRGHAIAHTMGGGEDINLVPQLGAVNIGAFQVLEKQARATPGALYFTFWIYAGPKEQVPLRVEQGLLVPGAGAEIVIHRNQPD